MPRPNSLNFIMLFAIFLVACGTPVPNGISASDPNRLIYHPIQNQELFSDEIAIYAVDSASDADIQNIVNKFNGSVVGKLHEIQLYQIRFENIANDYHLIDSIVERVKSSPFVKHAFYNTIYETARIPQDWNGINVINNINWAQTAINLPDAWSQVYDPAIIGALVSASGAQTSQIAVIDAAFDIDNNDLRNVSVVESIGGSNNLSDCKSINTSHGNSVAALIGANGNSGTEISGVNWTAKMHLYPLFRKDIGKQEWCSITPSGKTASAKFMAMEAFISASSLASANSPVVINYSFGVDWTCNNTCSPDPAVLMLQQADALRRDRDDWFPVGNFLQQRNVLVVAAAGNNSDIPAGRLIDAKYSGGIAALAADFQNIIVVASLGNAGFSYDKNMNNDYSTWLNGNTANQYKLSGYSSVGDLISIAAPGASIATIDLKDRIVNEMGTSFSAPLVSGVASLIWYINPKLSPSTVKNILIESAKSGIFAKQVVDITGKRYNYPVLDADEAVREAIKTINISPACTDNCNGHGVCTSGKCVCKTGYMGAGCRDCAVGYSGYPTCASDCGVMPQISWVKKANPPGVISDYVPVSVIYQGKLHIFKGDLHYGYDPTTDVWSGFSNIPYPYSVDDGVASVVNGKIYTMSAGLRVPLGTRYTLLWNELSDSWTQLDTRLGAQRFPAYSYLNNEIIVAGSYSDKGDDGAANAYNPAMNTWRALAPIPNPPGMSTLAFGSYGGSLFIFGGLPNRNLVQAYDPLANKWTSRQPAPIARDSARGFVSNQQLWIVGGWDPKAGNQDTIWIYDILRDKWCSGPSLPTKSADGPIMEQINGKLYLIGSWPPDMWQGTLQ